MTQRTLFSKLSLLVLTTLVFTLALHGMSSHAQTHIYVDAVNGTNAPGNGAAAKPYKSITYALLLSTRGELPDPWHVHIHPGTYDANPAKPASEREIFPLKLRNEMIFEGTTTAEECVIDGQHTGSTPEPILTGTDIEGIIIRNLTIQNSLRTQNVGGIILDDPTGTKETPSRLERCIVHNNKGGGMWTNMPFILTGNTFSNNNGNGITTTRSIAATNNLFSGNGNDGLFINGDSTGNISENTFQNNSRGVHITGTLKANVAHNIFDNNRGDGVNARAFTGDVTHNTFKNNGGPGFYAHTFTGDVSHNTFDNNPGGFGADTFTGDVTHNTIDNNYGSGFNAARAFIGDVSHNTFDNNHAYGLWAQMFTGDVSHNTFNNSRGGFRVNSHMTGNVIYNKFTRNTRSHGGGLSVEKTLTGNITHNIFDSNSAGDGAGGGNGGAVRLGSSTNTVEVFNNIFFNNTAKSTGNSVFTRHATHFMNNLFMISDELSEGVSGAHTVWVNSPECRFHNNIFSGVQTAIAIEGSLDLPITHNLFHDVEVDFVESAGNNLGVDLAFWELIAVNASDNLEGVPLLVDPVTSRDFHLQAGSPAIDAGTNEYAPSDDFDRVARPVGETVDIGPYEYGGISRTPHALKMISGDNQQGTINTALANPFIVEVTNQSGSTLSDVTVTFAVTEGGGSLSTETATTDADGRAESTLTLGSDDGTNTVTASVSEIQGAVTFTAVSTPPADLTPYALERISGDNQQGAINTALANPFVVEVINQDGSALAGVTVTFDVTAGGGVLSTESATTDADGRAKTTLTLGSDDGTNTVTASVSEIQGAVTFTAVATPPETRLMVITGTITNMDGTPTATGLPVTATIGSTTQTAVSESGGNYNVTFVKTSGIVARSSDTVEVQVVNRATGESARISVQLSSEQILAQIATIDLQLSIAKPVLDVPAGISLIHVPLKVTMVDGEAMPLNSVGDLYDALGGVDTINILITRDPTTERWISYLGDRDRGKTADKALTDDLGIIASMNAPVSISLGGAALGTDGSSAITLHPGTNLVGVPLQDSRIARVSDLFFIEGAEGNVQVIIVSDNGQFKLVARPGDDGDIPITGGQSFILTARAAATVAITGTAWYTAPGTSAAPPTALTGLQVDGTTPVLAVSGSIATSGPVGGKSLSHPFRVTVKNLSTGKVEAVGTDDDGGGYQLTFVDLETGRAAQIGDTLEISAQSPNPLIGVHPLRYVVTAKDVQRGHIPLGELVAYEIPAQTELLGNYPNPFNPETWIPYRLAKAADVTLTIYDLSGGIVRTLNVGHRIAAVYENRAKAIYWNGRTEFGERVASGIYFYYLTAGDYSATRKMVILK